MSGRVRRAPPDSFENDVPVGEPVPASTFEQPRDPRFTELRDRVENYSLLRLNTAGQRSGPTFVNNRIEENPVAGTPHYRMSGTPRWERFVEQKFR